MGEMEWILLAAGPFLAVVGAVWLALQKRGKLHPAVSADQPGGRVISGGGVMIIGIALGTIRLYRISKIVAGLYLLGFVIVYILIYVIFREK